MPLPRHHPGLTIHEPLSSCPCFHLYKMAVLEAQVRGQHGKARTGPGKCLHGGCKPATSALAAPLHGLFPATHTPRLSASCLQATP